MNTVTKNSGISIRQYKRFPKPSPCRLHTPTPVLMPHSRALKPRRDTRAVIVASAVSPPPLVNSFTRVATGVPLAEIMTHMTIAQAAQTSLLHITTVFLVVFFSNKVVALLQSKLDKWIAKEEAATIKDSKTRRKSPWLSLLVMVCSAAGDPCKALFPLVGFTYTLMVAAAFGEMSLIKFRAHAALHGASATFWQQTGGSIVVFLQDTAQFMQDAYEVFSIIFFAWFFLELKDKIVQGILANIKVEDGDTDSLARIIYPLSTLIGYATLVAATLLSLTAMGIDVKPAVAFGSFSTLAIGFAAQSTVANIVSAFSIYMSRPFIPGDRIQLKTLSGSTVITGTVAKIRPIHTVLKTDNGTPIFVHNKDIASTLLVINESNILKTSTTAALPTIDTSLVVRYKDVDKVAAIQQEVTTWLRKHPDILIGTSGKCYLDGFNTYGAIMVIKATLKREAASRKGEIFTEVLLYAENSIRRNGAYLAMERGQELPPPLPPVAC